VKLYVMPGSILGVFKNSLGLMQPRASRFVYTELCMIIRKTNGDGIMLIALRKLGIKCWQVKTPVKEW
jgi:hypothetical protein